MDNIVLNQKEQQALQEYLIEISKLPKISIKEFNELLKKSDKESQKKFIEGYLRYVVKYCLRICNTYQDNFDTKYPIMDFIQEGNLQLVYYVKKCNIKDISAFNLSFYSHLVRTYKKRVIVDKTETITNNYIDLLNAKYEFYKKNKCYPTIEELSSLLDLPVYEIKAIMRYFNKTERYTDNIDESVNVEEKVINKTINEEMLKIIDEADLTDREKNIIIDRYGINTKNKKRYNLQSNYYEIGMEHNITRQRVKQLEKKIIKILSSDENREKLKKLV